MKCLYEDYRSINGSQVPTAITEGLQEATGSSYVRLRSIPYGQRVLVERFTNPDRSPTVRLGYDGMWYLWIPRKLDGKSRLRIELGSSPSKEHVIAKVKPYAVKWSKAYMEQQERRRERMSRMEQRRTERLMMLETIGFATSNMWADIYRIRTTFWGLQVVVQVNEDGCAYSIESTSPKGHLRDEYTDLVLRLVPILNKLP